MRVIPEEDYRMLMDYLSQQPIKSGLVIYSKLLQAKQIQLEQAEIKQPKPIQEAVNVSD